MSQIQNKIICNLEGFEDLISNSSIAILSTVSPNKFPHSTVVWFDFDGMYFKINTMKGFQKEKNVKHIPLVNLFIYNPIDPYRSIEIRGKVIEMTEENAIEHLNNLCLLYTGKNQFFGDCIPKRFEENEIPVICKIKPIRIITMSKSGGKKQ